MGDNLNDLCVWDKLSHTGIDREDGYCVWGMCLGSKEEFHGIRSFRLCGLRGGRVSVGGRSRWDLSASQCDAVSANGLVMSSPV